MRRSILLLTMFLLVGMVLGLGGPREACADCIDGCIRGNQQCHSWCDPEDWACSNRCDDQFNRCLSTCSP